MKFFRDYRSSDMYLHTLYAASAALLVGSVLRDISTQRQRERMEHTLDRLDRQVDYVTDKVRENDPDYPPEDW